jgi:two-component system, NtrC family, sensor histidine kinase HydH
VFIQRTDHKIVTVALLMAAIISLNYFSAYILGDEHVLYRTLFYLPLVLGTVWFALKGALVISITTLLLSLPLAIQQMMGFSAMGFHLLLEALVFFSVTFILGFQIQRVEKERHALIAAERLSTIGRTVVEVAHDMRAPLVAIGGFATQVSRKLGDGDSTNREKLDIVVREAARLDGMVREMLDFGKRVELYLVKTSLNDLVRETAEVARRSEKNRGVLLELNLTPDLPNIPLDFNRLKRVVLNLITNAFQASPEGERVTVSTYATDRFNVVLHVIDAGCGIDKKDRDKIFHPFYSTKSEGTGMGLPIAKKIVEAHGGDLEFRPNKEKGVTFMVRLPVIPARI